MLWVRPLKELFHLLLLRDCPFVCRVEGFVEWSGDDFSDAPTSAEPARQQKVDRPVRAILDCMNVREKVAHFTWCREQQHCVLSDMCAVANRFLK
jgi:hypothetical protein